MSELYPLKFEPLLKERVWGGNNLVKKYGKRAPESLKIGESWEVSALEDNLSVAVNGYLAGNNIRELIEVFMGDLTGDKVFEKFGNEFPLLIKFIEAREDLSVQVHPSDSLARERHNAYGKTEMWYIIECDKDAIVYSGFCEPVTRDKYLHTLKEGQIVSLLNAESCAPGDVFFIPSGRIHATGAGTILAEIQQTSDITYRIYDWYRIINNRPLRELHHDLAVGAIDFSSSGRSVLRKPALLNKTETLIHCEFFNTNIIQFDRALEKDYNLVDSFVVYLCTEGKYSIRWNHGEEKAVRGETLLLPASIKEVVLIPEEKTTLLEIYIDTEQNM